MNVRRIDAPSKVTGALRYAGDMVLPGMLHVQAGAGIVADSVPENEWVETQNKARAVLRAAEMVQAGLDGGGDL